ncbi:Fatty-acid amide hydrolase 2 [Chionoecetes opilio]|uniref:Fatty-acid amide hydrolase 2 n=1 Tax=Chionoecetes opilio TaxID=41210 RepID=A0A8J5BTN2_CHIOP|nr:Fatty-acid amide hydrolase 2 [Chionoecetes opilio]
MVKGLSNTHGLVSRRGMKATRDAEVVRQLREAGAIPMPCQTVPELVCGFDATTSCSAPQPPTLTHQQDARGSSARGALLTSCGTPLSVGSDLGGSIRVPSFFCGVFGHKPTLGWVSMEGNKPLPYINKDKSEDREDGGVGPMCRCTADLGAVSWRGGAPGGGLAAGVAQTTRQPQDMVKIAQHEENKMTLVVAICPPLPAWCPSLHRWVEGMESPRCRATEPPLRKALYAARRHLQTTFGATTCQFQWPLDMAHATDVWLDRYEIQESGEPSLLTNMKNRESNANLPEEWLRWLCGRGRHTFPLLLHASSVLAKKPRDPRFSWKNVQKYFLETLGQNGVLLVPTMPQVAPLHGELLSSVKHLGINAIFSAPEMPSTAVPLGLSKDGLPLGLLARCHRGGTSGPGIGA